ncbi:hypothetical protein BJX61DRAFT_494500 [Aspergillus egyptiacus]|nr:hypothetical protein BJX61DRAFT_494500 [Aspergillus egyptiacus]
MLGRLASSMPVYPVRRRPRECKTCHQCRASKVRCDRNVPCSNCVKRGFNCTYGRLPPQLPAPPKPPIVSETYAAPTIVASGATSNQNALYAADPGLDDHLSDTVSVHPIEWEEINGKMREMEQVIASLKSLFQAHSARPKTLVDPGSNAPSSGTGQTPSGQDSVYGSTTLRTGSVHIGSRSALVDILDKTNSSAAAAALPKDDLLAELAMGNNEATAYPFVDLWSSDPYTFNIGGVCGVLPNDDQCFRLLGYYRTIGAVLYPVLPDIDIFEKDLKELLDGRRRAGGVYRPDVNGELKPFGMSISFLSLCFAVLASGCQLSDLPGIQREMTSWVYVSCSYQCLRMLNYVARPTVEIIQILLIISNVLSYNMNAGASYTLLGMTERMCMVLGLHVETPGYPPALQEARRRVWWAMAFQNSHFSLAYDRPSITMISQPDIPYHRKSMPGHRSYFETLCRIISVMFETLRIVMLSQRSHLRPHEIREHVQRIRNIFAEAAPHLRYREHCMTLADNIERAELWLHTSYYISVLCRVSLDPDFPMEGQKREHIRQECLSSLESTVEAFIDLHTVSHHASRTWISVQRTIASAFLLITNTNDQLWSQHSDLIQPLDLVLADHVYSDGTVNPISRTESAKHLSSSLEALRAVNAAFRANKSQGASRNRGTTPNLPATYPPSTPFQQPNNPTPIPPYPETVYGLPFEDGQIGNILNQVSDVMRFPGSVHIGNLNS